MILSVIGPVNIHFTLPMSSITVLLDSQAPGAYEGSCSVNRVHRFELKPESEYVFLSLTKLYKQKVLAGDPDEPWIIEIRECPGKSKTFSLMKKNCYFRIKTRKFSEGEPGFQLVYIYLIDDSGVPGSYLEVGYSESDSPNWNSEEYKQPLEIQVPPRKKVKPSPEIEEKTVQGEMFDFIE